MIYRFIYLFIFALPTMISAQAKTFKYYRMKQLDNKTLHFAWDKQTFQKGEVVIEVLLNPKEVFAVAANVGELQIQVPEGKKTGIRVFYKLPPYEELMILERAGATMLSVTDFSMHHFQTTWRDSLAILSFDLVKTNPKIEHNWLRLQLYWSQDDWVTPRSDTLLQEVQLHFGIRQSVSGVSPSKQGYLYVRALGEDGNPLWDSEPVRLPAF